jgi:hypothetical protein
MAVTYKRIPETGSNTNTNATTTYLSTGRVAGNSGDFSMQVVVTKTSGTVGGTVTPQYSIDGDNWVAIPGATALTLTDVATQTQIWNLTNKKALYYRLAVTTTGTQVSTSVGYYLEDEDHIA